MGNFIDVTSNIINKGSDGEVLGTDDVIFVDSGVKLEGLSSGPASGPQYDGIEATQASGDGVTVDIQGSVVGSLNGLAIDHVGTNNITITATGSVTSIVGGYGIFIGAGGNSLVNDGLIAGPAGGIDILAGQNTLLNGGTIISSAGPAIILNGVGNTINNTGVVESTGQSTAIELDTSNGSNFVTNSGQIAGAVGVTLFTAASETDDVHNSGTIQAQIGIWERDDGVLTVTNSGTISALGDGVEFGPSSDGDRLVNTGVIQASEATGVFEAGNSAIFQNNGSISGHDFGIESLGVGSVIINGQNGFISSTSDGIVLMNGHDAVTNHGDISGGEQGLAIVAGGNANDGSNSVLNSGTISAATNIALSLSGANNSITNSGTIDAASIGISLFGSGASGSNSITNSGELVGNIAIQIQDPTGLDTIQNTGVIGSNGISGNTITDLYGSSLTLQNAGKIIGINAIQFGSESGADTLHNSGTITAVDTAVWERGTGELHVFNSGDISGNVVLGGDGSSYNGVLGTLDGGVFGGSGSDTIKGGADGETLNGGAGNDTIKGGTGDDLITGGVGADKLVGGGGNDTFVYTGFADSHGPSSHDTIVGFDALSDTFNFGGTVTGVDKAIATGTLDKAAFNTDMQAILTSTALHAQHAVLFTANAGDLAGHTFLIVDGNGTAGFQPTADYVIELTQSTHLTGLNADNFI